MATPFIVFDRADQFCRLLQNAEQIAVLTHVNPDGDAIGTGLALVRCLKAMGKKTTIIAPNPFPEFLQWLDGAREMVVYKHAPTKTKNRLNSADLIICVDFNNLARLEELGEYIRTLSSPRVLIDHHPNPAEEEFTVCFSKVEACSSAEVLYNLLKAMGLAPLFTVPAIEALYAGMMTDTNNFLNNCSHPETFRTLAELLEYGIDKEKIHEAVYNNYSENRMRMLGYTLGQKMVTLPEYHTAYIALSRAELDKFQFQPGDTEGFVNYPLSIKDMVLSCFISENTDNIRLSFRSRGNFSVNDFSRLHFEGGGHLNAAGGISRLSLDETVVQFVQTLKQYKDVLARV
jgi:phosphoesterase RecJ-like protein